MSAHTRQSQTKTIERLTVLFCNAVGLVRGGKRSEEMVELLLDKLQRFKQNELKNETSTEPVVRKDPENGNSHPRDHVDDLIIAEPDKANAVVVQEEAKSPRRTIMNCEQFRALLEEHGHNLIEGCTFLKMHRKLLHHWRDCDECRSLYDRVVEQHDSEVQTRKNLGDDDETSDEEFEEPWPPRSLSNKLDDVNDALRVVVLKTDGSGDVNVERTNAQRKKVLEDLKLKPIQWFGRAEFFRKVSEGANGLLTIKYEASPSEELDAIHDEELIRAQQEIAQKEKERLEHIAERQAKFMESRKDLERHFCIRCGKAMHRPLDVSLLKWGYTRKCEDCQSRNEPTGGKKYCIRCGKVYHRHEFSDREWPCQLKCRDCAVKHPTYGVNLSS